MMLQDSATFLLGKLGRIAVDRFSERLAPLGLRPQHGSVLSVLAGRELASQQELGRILHQAPSGMVPVLDDLERMGAVRRVRDDVDRRRHALGLTAKGHELLKEVVAMADAVDAELLGGLPADDREALIGLLRQVGDRAGVLPVAG
jgi:DNA-binding MarR family transcriptional regulator